MQNECFTFNSWWHLIFLNVCSDWVIAVALIWNFVSFLIKWRSLSVWRLQGTDSILLMRSLHWATSIWHINSGQHDVFWRDPLDHFSSEHHSWRLPWCFALISHQVSYSEGFTQARVRPSALSLYQTTRNDWRSSSSPRQQWRHLFVFAICVRSWPCDAIVMRGSRIFHLSLAAWLAANGLCLAWFNPPSLQSAITYEMTTVSHPVSHLLWFHSSQQPNHSWEINERRWGVVGDSLITPTHTIL